MADEEKQTKETPEKKPVEEKQNKKEEEKVEAEEKTEEKQKEKPKKEVAKKQEVKKPQKTDKKQKKDKTEKQDKKQDHDPDFKYIVRISNTDIDGDKTLIQGITSIKGIGNHMATLVVDKINMDRSKKMGNLSDKEIEKIQETVDNLVNFAPDWMLNHRKDSETGDNIHLIGPQIELRHRDEINIMKKIRCYRGIRHERGLPARGQRTRANNRTGLTLGVSKKREMSK